MQLLYNLKVHAGVIGIVIEVYQLDIYLQFLFILILYSNNHTLLCKY